MDGQQFDAGQGQNVDLGVFMRASRIARFADVGQMAQELIDKQRDEATLRAMVEQRAKLRQRVHPEGNHEALARDASIPPKRPP
ncbi:siroheme synthase [Pelomonas saccharophila]|uniref:Siroheme synthase n=1 Tax=Roseateles saccharophilus TaxID=304 RepID=A0ABU1YG67_ROSSA|nr:hypothetical protein [Roseateles saccharophilus]MDR7267818.1 siroheme synthase [Roseateles saccharophilus]